MVPRMWHKLSKDKWLWGAVFVALILRLLPMYLWQFNECVRDECIYRSIAIKITQGQGLTPAPKGWLPAPGYPYLLAYFKMYYGYLHGVKLLQVVASVTCVGFLYSIGRRVADVSTGRWAAWIFAIHPTVVFFTGTLWIETLYMFFLISSAWAVLWSREGRWTRALLPGLLLGFAALFRGIATYVAPLFILAMLWPDRGVLSPSSMIEGFRNRWKHGLGLLCMTLFVLAPYSIHASQKHGGVVLSDATLGHVMFLSNNDFPPLTFDYGNGMLTSPLYNRYLRQGRPPCVRRQPPARSSRCDVEKAKSWILDNPIEFISRIPLRLAQWLNPHTFFTRHLRWGYWPGLDYFLKEALVFYTALFSAIVILGGTLGAWARAKGVYGCMAVGFVVYNLLVMT